MNILKWVWQDLGSAQATETTIEEYNRYLKPPRGVDKWNWFMNLSRAKYGDIVSGDYFKED